LAFLVFASSYIKAFLVFDIAEVIILIHKDLEPSTVGAPNLHAVCFSGRLDVPRLIVELGLDSL
jgi:hypothetical protein